MSVDTYSGASAIDAAITAGCSWAWQAMQNAMGNQGVLARLGSTPIACAPAGYASAADFSSHVGTGVGSSGLTLEVLTSEGHSGAASRVGAGVTSAVVPALQTALGSGAYAHAAMKAGLVGAVLNAYNALLLAMGVQDASTRTSAWATGLHAVVDPHIINPPS